MAEKGKRSRDQKRNTRSSILLSVSVKGND